MERVSAQEAGALGFMARLMVQTTLPHSARKERTFVRTNGALSVSINAHHKLGLPYGRYPRLLLAWLTTEAVRKGEAEIELGPSLSAFMAQLGLQVTGGREGSIGRLRDQMQRLFGATIEYTWDLREKGEWHDEGFRVANETHLWWKPVEGEDGVAWRSTVRLSPAFFETIRERPVPIDLRALKALRSPLAIDLYCWLTYRSSYLKRPARVPWVALAWQFGADYTDTKNFKRKLKEALRRLLVVYPGIRVETVRGGLLLKPARPHVSRRSTR